MRLYFASNNMVVVIKKFSVLFYTNFEKSKPSSVNFAGFFCIFQSCLLVCHFLFWFWLRWYYFPKNLVKVYCIHFCLPFFFQSFKKNREIYYLLFLFSFHLSLQFVSLALFFSALFSMKNDLAFFPVMKPIFSFSFSP